MSSEGDGALAWCRDYATALKHGSLAPYSQTERKARAATRNQPWGPTGTELARLAELSHSPTECETIMRVVYLRLAYPPKKWRNVYKGLTLLEYLLRHGGDACVARARAEAPHTLQSLAAGFRCVGADGRDMGVNVRHRAQAILALLQDDERLLAERQAHARKRGAYTGFGPFDVTAAGGPQAPPADVYAAAAQDGGHLSKQVSGMGPGPGDASQPGSPDYREREPGEAALRNAGETKGVSMEENRRYLAALRRLLDLPANRACADCAGPDAGSRPAWASINCGVFLCMRCAGVHRGMGVHVSKVRSCSLDTWLPEQVEFMARTGNALANAHWEARLAQAGGKPASFATLQELEAFVRRKYVAKEFAAGVWPPPQLADGPEVLAILAECLPPERARQLLGGSGAGTAVEAAAAPEERAAGGTAAATAAAAAINLIDFDFEPAAEAAPQPPLGGGLELHSLEGVIEAAAPAPGHDSRQGVAPPSAPAADLGSWDMGASLAARQHAEAVAAAAAATSAVPPRPPPYCPPWAPQPAAAPPGSYAHMQIVPAGAAFAPGFHGDPSAGGQPAAGAAPVGNPFALSAAGYYASQQPRPAAPSAPTPRPAPVRASPRPPASPAEAKAQELISRDLFAFNLHADTVSALGPPRLAPHHLQAAPAVPLLAMRTPR